MITVALLYHMLKSFGVQFYLQLRGFIDFTKIRGFFMKSISKLKQSFLKNSVWLMFQQSYSVLFSSLISIFVVRYLGPEQYGELEYVNSIISISIVICGLGLNNIIVYEMVKKHDCQGEVFGSAIALRVVGAFLAYIGLYVVGGLVEEPLIYGMLKLQGICLFFQVVSLFNEWFLMELNSKCYVIISIGTMTVSGGIKILLMYLGKKVEYFPIAIVAESFFLLSIIVIYFSKKKPFSISISLSCALFLLKKSKAYIVADLAIIIYGQIDKIMLNRILGEYEVGIYTTSSYVSTFWQFIPLALINSARTVIISRFQSGKVDYESYIKKLVLLVSALCLLILIGLRIFGNNLVLLLYGEEYYEAADYLMILGSGVWFSMLGCISSIWIVCNDVNKYSAYRTILGAVLNCILNVFFIKKRGIWGAAVATLITQFMTAIFFTYCFKKTRQIVVIYVHAFMDFFAYIKKQ